MRTLVLASLALLASPTIAEDIVLQKSVEPTCYTVGHDQYGLPLNIPGYATVRRSTDGHVYERNCDFMGNPRAAMSDIGMPADGFVNNASRGGATKVKILPNGHIKLY